MLIRSADKFFTLLFLSHYCKLIYHSVTVSRVVQLRLLGRQFVQVLCLGQPPRCPFHCNQHTPHTTEGDRGRERRPNKEPIYLSVVRSFFDSSSHVIKPHGLPSSLFLTLLSRPSFTTHCLPSTVYNLPLDKFTLLTPERQRETYLQVRRDRETKTETLTQTHKHRRTNTLTHEPHTHSVIISCLSKHTNTPTTQPVRHLYYHHEHDGQNETGPGVLLLRSQRLFGNQRV